MKPGVIIALALMPVPIIWPTSQAVAFVHGSRDAASRTITDASTNTCGGLQLAKHDHEDSDDDYGSVPRHGGHHKAKSFCSPYFKPSSALYFRDYYTRDNYANLPPGLRKHVERTGHLPPGLEKKYERTGQLPPGLHKRFECGQALPPDYSPYLYPVAQIAYERIGPLPPDSKLYLYGNDLILLNDHTRAIIDILRGAY